MRRLESTLLILLAALAGVAVLLVAREANGPRAEREPGPAASRHAAAPVSVAALRSGASVRGAVERHALEARSPVPGLPWTLVGTVSDIDDDEDRPLPGARVRVHLMRPGDESWVRLGETTSGAGGQFRVGGTIPAAECNPLAELVEIVVTSELRGFDHVRWWSVELDRSDAGVLCGTVELDHCPSRVRRGRVVDLAGRPVPGAEVMMLGSDDDEILTDPDGRFFLSDALVPGWPEDTMPAVRLLATSVRGASAPLDVAPSKELIQDLPDLVIAPSGSRLSGRVRFADGRPAAGVSVELTRLDEADASEEDDGPAPGWSDWFVLVTDHDGRFETWNAVEGTYEVGEARDRRVTTGVPAELVVEPCRVRFSMTSSDLCASRDRALELFVWTGASAEAAARCFDRGQRPAPCDERELIEPGESWWGSPGDFVIARPCSPGLQPAVAAHRVTASRPDSTLWFSLREPDRSTGVSIVVRGPARDRIEGLELQARDVRCPDKAEARRLPNGGFVALPPGRYELDVLPAPDSAGEGCSWYAVDRAEVVVTSGRVTPVELDVQRAARIELSLRSDIDLSRFRFFCGNAYEKEYELSLTSFATGEVIRGVLSEANGDAIAVPGRGGSTLSLRGAHHPGSYRLEFAVGALGSDDLLTFDRTVRLEAGLNKLAFDLTRRRR